MDIDREIKELFRENCTQVVGDNFSKEVVGKLPHKKNNATLLAIAIAICIGSVLCYIFGFYSTMHDVIVKCSIAVTKGQIPDFESLALFLMAMIIPSTISYALYAAVDDDALRHVWHP